MMKTLVDPGVTNTNENWSPLALQTLPESFIQIWLNSKIVLMIHFAKLYFKRQLQGCFIM